MEFYRGLN